MYAAETNCALPKKALTQRGLAMRASGPPVFIIPAMMRYSSEMMPTPSRNPASGEVIIGNTTFHSRPLLLLQSPSPALDQISAVQLFCEAASAAPHSPPISACEEDDGNPRHQVIRFQMIAPSNVQMSTCEVTLTTSVSTRPDAMVLATAVPMKAPTRLVLAASMIA